MPAARLMATCGTQWRTGFGGATGLDYNALFLVAGALDIQMDAHILRNIGMLERMTLDMWCEEEKD